MTFVLFYRQMNFKLCLCFLLLACVNGQAQSDLSQKSVQKSVYKIGIFDSPPLSFLDENNQPKGFVVDLLNEISVQENFEIEWVYDDWSHLMDLFKRNEIDMMTSVGYTDERSVFMDYSNSSFITTWGQVFLPNQSTIESIFDLNDKTIGVLKDGVNGQRFVSQCAQFEINCKIIAYDSYDEIFQQVANGRIDAGVSNHLVGSIYLQQYDLINSAIVFDPFKVYVACPVNAPPFLLNMFDKYLSLWKDNLHSFRP